MAIKGAAATAVIPIMPYIAVCPVIPAEILYGFVKLFQNILNNFRKNFSEHQYRKCILFIPQIPLMKNHPPASNDTHIHATDYSMNIPSVMQTYGSHADNVSRREGIVTLSNTTLADHGGEMFSPCTHQDPMNIGSRRPDLL
ncbi:hypothetical protein LWC05_05755 [Acetobacter sicerae]|uniref:Uncharacterized protein n=1 Tax=Acetobacter sicerae TaxID=85325 RepID=A0ABS8VTA5_9PROT|nr:hypothetical protein [Acetobacter sicerae]MCE0743396.1 hypothetical protein [Acetobacter sicerae]